MCKGRELCTPDGGLTLSINIFFLGFSSTVGVSLISPNFMDGFSLEGGLGGLPSDVDDGDLVEEERVEFDVVEFEYDELVVEKDGVFLLLVSSEMDERKENFGVLVSDEEEEDAGLVVVVVEEEDLLSVVVEFLSVGVVVVFDS